MNIEETKACIAVMQAYVDGKEIQFRYNHDNEWRTTNSPSWDWAIWEYRIKPEPTIIYVNEYDGIQIAHRTAESARIGHYAGNGNNLLLQDKVAIPYVRLSDVELLK